MGTPPLEIKQERKLLLAALIWGSIYIIYIGPTMGRCDGLCVSWMCYSMAVNVAAIKQGLWLVLSLITATKAITAVWLGSD